MGLLSATPSRRVAERYASYASYASASTSSASASSASASSASASSASASSASASASSSPPATAAPPTAALLLKLTLHSPRQQCGAPISWLSCFPHEQEWLYSPGTYLRPAGRPPTTLVSATVGVGVGGGARLSLALFRVVEVVPLPRPDVD